ncbi:ABC transporter permease [Kutzneria sp. CA-103260]|uniref:ABC transporter permease n=1 Tax=Kutzneria sp. CA-103260 TaxID=2802641 RepID=UPI001BA9A020|nr:ABC transporter permease [Kutzneria sp. CA-103260]QUQ64013.1 ABC transporter permease [Kutzneria sp. CA-103260]
MTTAQETRTEVATVESRHRGAARRHRILVHLTQVAVLLAVVGGWQLTVQGSPRSVILYGVPSGILDRLGTWISQGTAIGSLGDQILTTLEEALLGFVIGTALGIVCGIALGRIRFLSEVFGPFIKVLNAIPRIVLGSVFVLAFGLGLESKILLVIVLVFFGVFFNAFQGTREVDRNFVANASILGASRWQVTSQVVLPSAFTWIIASLHVSFGFALIGAIVGEFLGGYSGLGVLIKNAQGTFDANGVWAAMVIMGAVALVAEWLITRLENRLLRWRPARLAGPDL